VPVVSVVSGSQGVGLSHWDMNGTAHSLQDETANLYSLVRYQCACAITNRMGQSPS